MVLHRIPKTHTPILVCVGGRKFGYRKRDVGENYYLCKSDFCLNSNSKL